MQLESASAVLAPYITYSGVSKANAIVVVLHSCVEWALCFWTAAELGCPFVPINPAIAGMVNELQHILSALGNVGALVADD